MHGRKMSAPEKTGLKATTRFAEPASFKLEPTLEEILADPIIRLMMARDHVRSADVQALMAGVRRRRTGLDARGSEAF